MEKRKFIGFISYSRKDNRYAKRLHRALEHYRIPKKVTGLEVLGGKRLGRFFRDYDEFAATSDLGAAIRGALDDSENLIVLCSPNSERSSWVNREVQYFGENRNRARVFAVIIAGEPNASDSRFECYAPALRSNPNMVPLGIPWRGESFMRMKTRMVAGLLGVGFDLLWDREKRRQAGRRIVFSALGLMTAIAAFVAMEILAERQFMTRLANEAQELSERRRYSMEGKYGTNEPLIGERRLTEALPITIASLPHDSYLLPYEGVVVDCGCFGEQPEIRCVALRLAFGLPQKSGNIEFDSSKFWSREIFSKPGSDGGFHISLGGSVYEIETDERGEVEMKGEFPVNHLGQSAVDVFGQRIAIGAKGGRVGVIDKKSGVLEFEDTLLTESVTEVLFSPNGKLLLARSSDGRFGLVEMDSAGNWNLRKIREEQLDVGEVNVFAFSPDSMSVVLGFRSGCIRFMETRNRDLELGPAILLELNEPPFRIEFDKRDKYMAVSSRDQVGLLDLERKSFEVLPIKHAQDITALDFSPCGRRFLSAALDNNVVVWSIEECEVSDVLSHGWHVEDAAFISDGSRIISATHHGDVWVWDLETNSELMRVDGTEGVWPMLDLDNEQFILQPKGDERLAVFRLRDLSKQKAELIREDLGIDYDMPDEYALMRRSYGLEGRPFDPRDWRGLRTSTGWAQFALRVLYRYELADDFRQDDGLLHNRIFWNW